MPETTAVFMALERAAEEHLVCPTNAQLANLMGWESISTPARHIQLLEDEGLIKVERGWDWRVVTIGKLSTARKPILGDRKPKSKSPNVVKRVTSNSRAMEKGADMRHRGDPLAVKKPKRTIGGWRPKVCQFIEGEPSFDESCKCRKPLLPGSSYCAEHHERCWFGRVEKVKAA